MIHIYMSFAMARLTTSRMRSYEAGRPRTSTHKLLEIHSHSRNARKRRRGWEGNKCAVADAAIGTLEMAHDIKQHCAWATPIVVIDEAAQATEPMALIPLMMARYSAHIVLIGDHMTWLQQCCRKKQIGRA